MAIVKSNAIGIVGIITGTPQLVLNATEWEQRVYETKLTRKRPSGVEDAFVLQFDGCSLGREKMLDKIVDGTEVLIYGEIRTENKHSPLPGENRIKIFIYAEVLIINNPPAEQQNEVNISGKICRTPRIKHKKQKDKQISVTDIIVAVAGKQQVSYIPCICWRNNAEMAAQLEVGTYVEIIGRFQSRQFRKNIQGSIVPYVMTAYEVSVKEIIVKGEK